MTELLDSFGKRNKKIDLLLFSFYGLPPPYLSVLSLLLYLHIQSYLNIKGHVRPVWAL